MPINDDHSKEPLTKSIRALDKDVQQLDHDVKEANKQNRTWPSFWRGIVGSLGAVIGATILISLILYLLQRLAVLPVIGEIFKLALEQLRQGKPGP